MWLLWPRANTGSHLINRKVLVCTPKYPSPIVLHPWAASYRAGCCEWNPSRRCSYSSAPPCHPRCRRRTPLCLNMVDKLWHVYEFVMDDVLPLPDYYCRQPSPHAINITHFYGPIKSTIIIRNPHLMPKSIIYRCPDYIYRLAGGAAASALIQFPHQLRLLRSFGAYPLFVAPPTKKSLSWTKPRPETHPDHTTLAPSLQSHRHITLARRCQVKASADAVLDNINKSPQCNKFNLNGPWAGEQSVMVASRMSQQQIT